MTNRYNQELRLVTPSQGDAYAITPAQAQQLDRMTQPIHIPEAPASQVSATKIDVSAIFAPLPIKEEYSPVERGKGFAVKAFPFVLAALFMSLAGAWLVELNSMEWFAFFAFLFLVTLVMLNWQETTYSAAGVALRHQADAKDALHVIVASNEAVTMAKLENEDRAHEREVALRRDMLVGYINKLGGDK